MKSSLRRPLRLGIDLRDLKTAVSGQKTYLEELLKALQSHPGKEVDLVCFRTVLPVYTGGNRWLKLVEHFRLHFWKQVILPLKAWWHNCDVLFTTDYFVPYYHLGFKTVTVFHDAFFFENPEHYSPLFLKFFHRVAVPAARRCDKILVPSLFVQQKLHRFLKVPEEKLVCVYEAPKSLGQKKLSLTQQHQRLKQWQLDGKSYLLHVGMLNKRKNIPVLIHAFQKVKILHPDLKLVLAGSMDAKPHINDRENIERAVADTGLANDIVFTGYMSDEDLAVLYSHAKLYVFPSTNEGFGLPVLEAFLHGVPVLVANNSCLPEIGGDAVVAFDPYDIQDLADKINSLLSGNDIYHSMKKAGYSRLRHFSWDKAAESVVAICQNIT